MAVDAVGRHPVGNLAGTVEISPGWVNVEGAGWPGRESGQRAQATIRRNVKPAMLS